MSGVLLRGLGMGEESADDVMSNGLGRYASSDGSGILQVEGPRMC